MDATRKNRFVCILVNDGGMHPVSAGVNDLYLNPFIGLNDPLFFDFPPLDSAKRFTLIFDFNTCGRRWRILQRKQGCFCCFGIPPSL